MKQLIISIYDSYCDFSYQILENNKKVKWNNELCDMKQFNLLNEYYNVEIGYCNSDNEAIQQFDQIIICEDGDIDVAIKGIDY